MSEPAGRASVSLCMIVKDEEQSLERCLDSVTGVVDEIVVVDTGSSDRTAAIAAARGARVVTRPWTGDFSRARNVSLQLARGDWVLVLDADEELDRRDRAALRALVDRAEAAGGPQGYLLRVVNHLGPSDDLTAPEVHAALRLFRNRPEHRYRGLIHEQPQVPGPALTDVRIHHWGYLPETYARRRKAERNEGLLLKALAAQPDDPYLLYSLAALRYAAGDFGEADRVMSRALELIEPWRHYRPRALKILALARKRTSGPAAAAAVLDQAVAAYPDFTDLYFLRAGCRRDLGDRRGAAVDLCRCLIRGEAPARYDRHEGVGGKLAAEALAGLLAETAPAEVEPDPRARPEDGRGVGSLVLRALGVAAARAEAQDDADTAELCYAVGIEVIRRVTRDPAAPGAARTAPGPATARQAGRLAAAYVRFLRARTIAELRAGVKAAPWCETLTLLYRRLSELTGDAAAGPPVGSPGAAPAGPPVGSPAAPSGGPAIGPVPGPGAGPRTDPTAASGALPGAAGPTVSACLIVRDEAVSLDRCLGSLAGAVDEIIVVDTGSIDGSPEVAARHGATVLPFAWTDDFSRARNYGLQQARGEWILCLDADEELAPGNAALLKPLLAAHPEAEGFLVRIVDYLGEYPGVDRAANLALRLFRNRPEHRYTRALHEQMQPAVTERDGRPTVLQSPLIVYHYGYLSPVDRAKRRGERNLALAAKEVEQRADPFSHFNLAAEYLKAGRYSEALAHYREVIDKVDHSLTYAAEARIRAAVTLALLGALSDALAELTVAEREYPAFTDVVFLKGEVLRLLGRHVEAAAAFARCLELGEAPAAFPTLLGVGTYRAATCLGEEQEKLGSPAAALAGYARALESEPRFVPAYLGRARALRTIHGAGAREVFERELAARGLSGPKLCLLAGYAWLCAGQPDWALPYLAQARTEVDRLEEGLEKQAAAAKTMALLGLALFFLGRDGEAADNLSATGQQPPAAALTLALLAAGRLEQARAAAETRTAGLKSVLLSAVVAAFEGAAREELGPLYRSTPQTYVETAVEIVSLGARRRHPGLLEAALTLMRPVEDLGPWLRLGKLYHEVGLEKMAEVELTECLERGAADVEGTVILAEARCRAGRLEEARALFSRVVEEDPSCWRAWLGLGRCRWTQAARAAAEAASLLPGDLEVARLAREIESAGLKPILPA